MQIAYVTTYDATNPQAWSGSGYNIQNELKKAGVTVHLIGPLKTQMSLFGRLSQKIWWKFGYSYLPDRDPHVLKRYASEASLRMQNLKVDLILSPGSIPIAHLNSKLPIVFWTDATFGGLLDYYWKGVAPVSIRHGHQMERQAIRRSSLCVYTSQWALDSARTLYKADSKKLRLIRFGSNCESIPQEHINEIIGSRSRNRMKLLFIGVDWVRKGAEKAIEVVRFLRELGNDAELNIVGIEKPPASLPDYVRSHGFLRKDNPGEAESLKKLLRESHFLILPTIADCVPVVFAEANANGIPVISHRTGGVSSYVEHRENGLLYDIEEKPPVIAKDMADCFADWGKYEQMCLRSHRFYNRHSTWSSSIGQFLEEVALLKSPSLLQEKCV